MWVPFKCDFDRVPSRGIQRMAAIIPMRDKADLTQMIVEDVMRTSSAEIYIMDNNSVEPESHAAFARWKALGLTVIHCADDDGIHAMWNRGAMSALIDIGPDVMLLFLNNDVSLFSNSIHEIVKTFDSDIDYTVLGFNVTFVDLRCDVYRMHDVSVEIDDLFPFSGAAFAVRGQFFEGGFKFPEELTWWRGDNHIIRAAQFVADRIGGHKVGVVNAARAVHQGGATAGFGWTDPKWKPIIEADTRNYHAWWARAHKRDIQINGAELQKA